MTWLEMSSVVPASASARKRSHSSGAQDGVQPHRGLVEDDQLRRAEHRDGERNAILLTARERTDEPIGLPFQPDLAGHSVDVAARRPRMRAK
jgi:hypothetical protein